MLATLTLADSAEKTAIWNSVLSHVKQDAPTDQTISPYFNACLLSAMSATNHRQQALNWLRQYWGGMLAELTSPGHYQISARSLPPSGSNAAARRQQ